MFNITPFKGRNNLITFNDFFNDDFFKMDEKFWAPFINNGSYSLVADIIENDNEFLIEMDVPGMDKKDISIDYMNNNLVVSGKRIYENENDNYIRRERRYGQFKRSFYVNNIDDEKISASFDNGVLKIILPKIEKQKPKSKKIDIQ